MEESVLARNKLRLLSIFAVIVAVVFSVLAPQIIAQQDQTTGSGLQLSPTRSEISGQPGETKTFSLTLKNITQNDVTAQAFLNDFQSDNDSGTPRIIVDSNQRTPYTLANMLKTVSSVDLKAGETKEIKHTLTIPTNASPGAYFGALRYAAVPKGQEQNQAQRQVALTASVAHLVFLELPGQVNQQIQIESLKAQKNGKAGSFFFDSPNQVALGIRNKGNGFSRPFGKVNVNGPFGSQVASYDVNNSDPRGIVLPDSARKFTNDVKGIKLPGKYNLTASVAYGNGGEVVNYKTSFIYLPLWAIVLILVLLLAIAGAIFYLYRRKHFKSKKKRQ